MKHLLSNFIFLITTLLIGMSISYSQVGWFGQNPLPQANDLRSVFFTNGKTGIAVGLNGTILHTIAGGLICTPKNIQVVKPQFA